MRVAIVGAGAVGTALAANFERHGHEVVYGVRAGRDPGEDRTCLDVETCGAGADLVVLAVPFGAVGEVVPRLGLGAEHVLVDATNPFGATLPAGFASGLERVQGIAGPEVRVVKAFNVLGAEHMAQPELADGDAPILPVAGADRQAVARVVDVARQLGFDALDVGDADAAVLMEFAAQYWGLIAFRGGRGRRHVLVSKRR